MKKMFQTLLMVLCLVSADLAAQKHEDRRQMKVDLSQFEEIHLYNTSGNVSVTPSMDHSATIEIRRSIEARSNKKLEEAKSSIYFDTTVVDGRLYFFVNNPYSILEIDDDGNAHYNSRENGKWRWSGSSDKKTKFEFTLDITMPVDKHLVVSTHRKDLKVKGHSGVLVAKTHHGSLKVEDVKNLTLARSHHGDIEASYAVVPSIDTDFKTHHGDIQVAFPSSPSAEISMYSHHGDFYTDFEWTSLPLKVKTKKNGRQTKFKYGGDTSIKMGDGKNKMTFKSHHGDMYIMKKG